MTPLILKVAVPTPLRTLFDYLSGSENSDLYPVGARVIVPFGRGQKIGTIVKATNTTNVPSDKLKSIIARIDHLPLYSKKQFELLIWSSNYYHHPIGEVISSAQPKAIREGKEAKLPEIELWQLSDSGKVINRESLKRAPKQQQILEILSNSDSPQTTAAIGFFVNQPSDSLKRLLGKGLVTVSKTTTSTSSNDVKIKTDTFELNNEQLLAVSEVTAHLPHFKTFLLDGITGSGKTEVYFQVIAKVLAEDKQALILVPEIGLTPQLLKRFQQRFSVPIAMLHSGLADGERFKSWLMAKEGVAPIVIGTRSAVFTPLDRPGLIVIDEEHDGSFKQQEGFRYSARDVAIKRAQLENVPIILGSATPSLESLNHAINDNYRHIKLRQRATNALLPKISLLDTRKLHTEEGLSQPLLNQIKVEIGKKNQVLLFLNRRGFSPVILCYECNWTASCKRCDSRLTYYHHQRLLRCHHCGSEYSLPSQCPSCNSTEIHPVGEGTERLESSLKQHFPDNEIIRIDRDTTRNRYAFEEILEKVHDGIGQILIGTQLIAKGHHFPNVTLVAIVNADQGLFSIDFRGSERMAQQIIQVAGRAGRAEKPGQVLIQTTAPDHPLWGYLKQSDYYSFAQDALVERQQAQFPPYYFMALIRCESHKREEAHLFLNQFREQVSTFISTETLLFGPVPSPMERRSGRYRAQLIIQSKQRAPLHHALNQALPLIEKLPQARKVRWSIDIHPAEMY